jgi:hypothetical protein
MICPACGRDNDVVVYKDTVFEVYAEMDCECGFWCMSDKVPVGVDYRPSFNKNLREKYELHK